MIRVRDLHKTYQTQFGTKTVLEDVNFDLAMGERLGILGRNGAGKSTLIRLVSGAEKPTSGTIERDMSISWPLAFGGAFQPQLTGIDNIRFITSIYDQDFARNLAFVEKFAELGPYLREPVRSYSSGMRARLAFAISMIIEFDCFLIDEIGAVGDARFHDRCNHELFEVRGDRAMIIISHDASYLREHCNRWAILHEGRMSHFDDFETAYSQYKELIGAEGDAKPAEVAYTNRARMIESSQRAALTDERFRVLVQEGDWARDERNWPRARKEYAKALALYPYQRSYWVQHGHAAKEDGQFASAEISYRTAIALGEPLADIEDHALFVMNKQGFDSDGAPLRVPYEGPARTQPPGLPDVELATWLFGGSAEMDESGVLDLLHAAATCDDLAAGVIDARYDPTGANPLSDDGKIERALCLFGGSLHQGRRAALAEEASSREDLVTGLFRAGAFDEWPKTRAALAAHLETALPGQAAPQHSSRVH